jgi:hypothetical protein
MACLSFAAVFWIVVSSKQAWRKQYIHRTLVGIDLKRGGVEVEIRDEHWGVWIVPLAIMISRRNECQLAGDVTQASIVAHPRRRIRHLASRSSGTDRTFPRELFRSEGSIS